MQRCRVRHRAALRKGRIAVRNKIENSIAYAEEVSWTLNGSWSMAVQTPEPAAVAEASHQRLFVCLFPDTDLAVCHTSLNRVSNLVHRKFHASQSFESFSLVDRCESLADSDSDFHWTRIREPLDCPGYAAQWLPTSA